MKKNYLSFKDKNGTKKEYRILFNIESANNKNYVIYKDDLEDEDGEVRAFISSYEISDKGNMTKLKNIKEKDDIIFITKILNTLQK